MKVAYLIENPADRYASVMFALSLVFVALLAILIVLWVDVPRVAELSALEQFGEPGIGGAVDSHRLELLIQQNSLVRIADPIGKVVQLTLLVLWPLFWLEYLLTLTCSGRNSTGTASGFIRLLACLMPPLRLAAPSAAHGGCIWLPRLGWQQPGKALHAQLERAFGKPMLLVALLILPILLIEYGLHSLVENHEALRVALHVSTGFIWCAFTIEFLIMVSATDKRIHYIKTHWIDLAIILLPLISFLRSLRVLRLGKLAKVQKMAKMGRVFRVRGLLMKVLRALMLLGFVNRILRITPEKRLARLKNTYDEQLKDLEDLQEEIRLLEESMQ